MINWQTTLIDPIYSIIGVEAVLTPSSNDVPVTVTVIDKTAGVEVADEPMVSSIKPAADVRASDLASNGITREDLHEGTVTFNGATWNIVATLPRPTPGGEAQGEVRLILTEPEE